MITTLLLIGMFMLLIAVIRTGIRLAWGFTKFIFGLGLFWFCPLLFVLAVLMGAFQGYWIVIIVLGLLFGGGFLRK